MGVVRLTADPEEDPAEAVCRALERPQSYVTGAHCQPPLRVTDAIPAHEKTLHLPMKSLRVSEVSGIRLAHATRTREDPFRPRLLQERRMQSNARPACETHRACIQCCLVVLQL
jgi:hypothetical protein